MEEQIILQYAKDYVAAAHGFKNWLDIDEQLNTGWTNDGEVQESVLLDEVALKYGKMLLYFRDTGMLPWPEDKRHPDLQDLIHKNMTEDNLIFTNRVHHMIESGWDKNEMILKLIQEATDVFTKFKKLMAHWPIQYSKLPEDL